MPSNEQPKGDKIWEHPEIGLNSKLMANLTAYFTRQNANYGIEIDFGLAQKTYKDWLDFKKAEERQEFLLNRSEMLRKWLSGVKSRLREIKLELHNEDLTNAEKQKLLLESFEIDNQISEMAKSLGIPYAGRFEQFTISHRD